MRPNARHAQPGTSLPTTTSEKCSLLSSTGKNILRIILGRNVIVVGFRNLAKDIRLLQGSEVQSKYSGLALNPVKVEGIEYIQKPDEEGEEGIPRREAVCVYKADNLTYINAQPSVLSSQFSQKTGASTYTVLRSSSTPCATLLAVLDRVISQLSLGAQVTIIID
jgi:hypothetical protein